METKVIRAIRHELDPKDIRTRFITPFAFYRLDAACLEIREVRTCRAEVYARLLVSSIDNVDQRFHSAHKLVVGDLLTIIVATQSATEIRLYEFEPFTKRCKRIQTSFPLHGQLSYFTVSEVDSTRRCWIACSTTDSRLHVCYFDPSTDDPHPCESEQTRAGIVTCMTIVTVPSGACIFTGGIQGELEMFTCSPSGMSYCANVFPHMPSKLPIVKLSLANEKDEINPLPTLTLVVSQGSLPNHPTSDVPATVTMVRLDTASGICQPNVLSTFDPSPTTNQPSRVLLSQVQQRGWTYDNEEIQGRCLWTWCVDPTAETTYLDAWVLTADKLEHSASMPLPVDWTLVQDVIVDEKRPQILILCPDKLFLLPYDQDDLDLV